MAIRDDFRPGFLIKKFCGEDMVMDHSSPFRINQVFVSQWEVWRKMRLAALLDTPSAYESTYEQWKNAPESSWRNRLSSVELNLMAEDVDGISDPLGIASGFVHENGSTAELISMWVTPSARGRGVADALIDDVVNWAEGFASEIWLALTPGNDRAKSVYLRHGFTLSEKLGAVTAGGYGRELLMVKSLP